MRMRRGVCVSRGIVREFVLVVVTRARAGVRRARSVLEDKRWRTRARHGRRRGAAGQTVGRRRLEHTHMQRIAKLEDSGEQQRNACTPAPLNPRTYAPSSPSSPSSRPLRCHPARGSGLSAQRTATGCGGTTGPTFPSTSSRSARTCTPFRPRKDQSLRLRRPKASACAASRAPSLLHDQLFRIKEIRLSC